jgi:lysozyme
MFKAMCLLVLVVMTASITAMEASVVADKLDQVNAVSIQAQLLKEVSDSEENAFPFKTGAYGIDISHWQGTPDFAKVVASKFHDRQLTAVFLKATEGTGYVDKTYYSDSAAISQHSQITIMGAYHFFLTGNTGKSQAEHLASVLDKDPHFKKDKHYFVIDVESNKYTPSKALFAQSLMTFVDTMHARGYKNGMIYVGKSFWDSYIGSSGNALWSKVKLWMPRYGVNNGEIPSGDKWYTELPTGATKCSIWQFTSKGRVNGIGGDVDLDLIGTDL